MSLKTIVLVNSESPLVESESGPVHQAEPFLDFERYIKPYLEHFGVPISIIDISVDPLPLDIGEYALIMVGHRNLDPEHTYLNETSETMIVDAVKKGTGLVNFDNILAEPGSCEPLYRYVRDIFNFRYKRPHPANSIGISGTRERCDEEGHYVTSLQPKGNLTSLKVPITPAGLTASGSSTVLATADSTIEGHRKLDQPLLIAAHCGEGRAVQWTSYDWARITVKGYVSGLDDLVWRSIVWAARKPFVIRGMPPFVTMRVDDAKGSDNWSYVNFTVA